MADHKTDPETLPALGRLLGWVDRPGAGNRILWVLVTVCVILFAIDLLPKAIYYKKTHFDVEKIPGAYGIYGYVMFSLLIAATTGLRWLIKRDEDYYADRSVDTEEYPDAQLEKETHDGV